MKHHLLCTLLVAGVATQSALPIDASPSSADSWKISDPSVFSEVGATLEDLSPAPISFNAPQSSAVSLSDSGMRLSSVLNGSAMRAASIPGSTATPDLLPMAAGNVNLSSLPGKKSLWVGNYSDYKVTTYSTTIALKEGSSYTAFPFIYQDVELNFTIDSSTGAVSIPVQKVAELDGNIISICKIDLKNLVFSPTDALAGSVVDGNLFIDDAFGFFVTEGPAYGQYLNIGIIQQAVAGTPNSTFRNTAISFTNNEMTTANRHTATSDYSSFVYQLGPDRVRILNVPVNASIRGALTVSLTSQGTAQINPQPATVINPIGEFFYYGLTEKTSDTGAISFSVAVTSPISLAYNASAKTLTLPCWGVARTNALLSYNEAATVTLPFSLEFPKAPAFNLPGDGSQENPWLIRSAEDFVALGADILTNTAERGTRELVPGSDTDYYYPVYKDKYFRLANDIDFSTLDGIYSPIGSKTYQFAGVLDGDGHTISNLTFEDYAYDYCGLFAVTAQSSSISNLAIANADISSLGYTAGTLAGYAYGRLNDITISDSRVIVRAGYNAGVLAGYTRNVSDIRITGSRVQAIGYVGGLCGRSYGPISNCSVEASVLMTGKQMFGGGIVGHQTKTYSNEANYTISDCQFSGTVQCSADQIGLGGLSGALSYAVMQRCVANAVVLGVSGVQTYMGGLTGTLYDAVISDCYASGFVRNDASSTVGGLVGHVTKATTGSPVNKILRSYASNMLSSASTDPMRGLIGTNEDIIIEDSYFDSQISAVEGTPCGLSTDSLTSGAALKGFDTEVWNFSPGIYPRLKDSENSAIAAVASAALVLPAGQTIKAVEDNFTYSMKDSVEWSAVVEGKFNTARGYAFSFDNGVGKLNYEQQTDTIFVKRAPVSKYYIVNIAPVLFEGEGSSENPWKISSKADLAKLSEMSAKAALSFEGKYFLQTADIDMEGMEIDPICKDASGKLRFLGTYDGNGHTIDNLKIASVGFFNEDNVTGTAVPGQVNPKDPKSYNYGGLFATIGAEGVVRNLTIGRGCRLDFFQNGGAIAGGLYGTIENCYNLADVKVYYINGGGIAGQAFKGAEIRGCYNGGAVSVNANTGGGIVGLITDGRIVSCENTGTVSGKNFNPYQKPEIQKTVGGIAGKASSSFISDVANSGEIDAFTEVGGIVGNAAGTVAAPDTIANALNYGFLTSRTSLLSLGAISGVNACTVYDNCISDSRLQHIGLVANGAMEGARMMPTADIIASDSLFHSPAWSRQEKGYPIVALTQIPGQLKLNSTAIISWSGNDYAQAMVGSAGLSEGQSWSVAGSDAFSVSGNSLNVTIPAEGIVQGVLTAVNDGFSRSFPLKSFQYDIFEGSGSAEDPFLIPTADEFLRLADMVNLSGFNYSGFYFSQTADLDFTDKSFVPVGFGGGSFGAIYKGNGHTVKAVNYANPTTDKTITTGGLFGIVDFTGEISGITLDEKSVVTTYSNAGGIVGTLYGKVSDCQNRASVSTYGTTAAGGVVGYAYPGAGIIGCSNSGAVTAKTNYAGGVLAQAPANAGVKVEKCSNSGAVSGASKIGGVIGSASASIMGCSNSGPVTASTSYGAGVIGEALAYSSLDSCKNSGVISAPQYAAGVIAMSVAHTEENPLTITACVNTADLEAGAKGYAGGLAGSLNNYVVFTDCHNSGNISGATTGNGGLRLGGIISSTGKYTTFIRCYNTGDVTAYSNSGGIAGYTGDKATFEDCYNTGRISGGATAATNVGGLVGSGPVFLTRCYNTGDVSGAGYQVGGLNGQNTTSQNPIVDCFNTGNVTGKNKVGGLIGMGRGLLNGCVNYGTVTAENEAAGIIGVPGNAAAASFVVRIENSLSLGAVVCKGANSAAVMAENTSCKFVEMENNYFDSSVVSATANDEKYGAAVKGLSADKLAETAVSDAFRNEPACYPMLKSMAENGVYNFYSAFVQLADGETPENVRSSFMVGQPGLVEWSASEGLVIDGSDVHYVGTETSGSEDVSGPRNADTKAWVKKSFGDLEKVYELMIDPVAMSVDDLEADSDILEVSYFTLDGHRVVSPEPGQVIIRRALNSNGIVHISKIIIR